ncbi:MAG: hypothetical protein L3K26_12140, partial [Candidatus Hydrogenedentes bacterium]|nr:hypothetical protein [Candidatus Hydrogenedentota bacterium]
SKPYYAYFQGETVALRLSQESLQAPEAAYAEVREYLAGIDDVRAWLDTGQDVPLPLPERFHIEVQDHPLEILVRCYWVRWEDGGDIGERVRTRIAKAFPNALIPVREKIFKNENERKRMNRLVQPTFLDDGIHLDTRRDR